MSDLFDKAEFEKSEIEITCPDCQHEFKETAGRLKANTSGTLTCPACKGTFTFNVDELRGKLRELDDELEQLQRNLGALGDTSIEIRI